MIHAAWKAQLYGARVFIGCPTGVLVSTYKNRMPESDLITVQTIHSGFRILRKADKRTYNPPSTLRHYDVFIFDEVSQLDDELAKILVYTLLQMPNKPLVLWVGDQQQLQSIGDGGYLRHFLEQESMKQMQLAMHENARSKDPVLLDWLHKVRTRQPAKQAIHEFFGDRHLGFNMHRAVLWCVDQRPDGQQPITWLTCTMRGAAKVNGHYLRILGSKRGEDWSYESMQQMEDSMLGDPDYGHYRMAIRPAMTLRLTKKLDKDQYLYIHIYIHIYICIYIYMSIYIYVYLSIQLLGGIYVPLCPSIYR